MTAEQWLEKNKNSFLFFYSTYPWLKDFTLPVNEFELKRFYSNDMRNRNLEPIKEFYDNYDFLFSYFLANYPIQNSDKQFTAPTALENIFQNIPEGISRTGKDIKSVIDSLKLPIVLILFFGVFYLYTQIK